MSNRFLGPIFLQQQAFPRRLAVRRMALSPLSQPKLKQGMVVVKEIRAEAEGGIIGTLQKLFPDVFTSDTSAKKGCRRKEVLLDGNPATTTSVVQPGNVVQLIARAGNAGIPQPQKTWEQTAQDRPGLEVIFEDDYLAVIVKPPGLPTQGKGQDNVQKRIKYCLTPSRALGASNRPYNVHRLDAPTSGLMVCAKTRVAGAQLAGMFAARSVSKRYIAIVKGKIRAVKSIIQDSDQAVKMQKTSASEKQAATDPASRDGEGEPCAATQGSAGPGTPQVSSGEVKRDGDDSICEGLIDHNVQGKAAQTRFRVMQVTPSRAHGQLTTLWLHPLTGRKHQLRRHCVDVLGCAILGDARYRGTKAKRGREHYLELSKPSHEHTLFSVAGDGKGPGTPMPAAAAAAVAALSQAASAEQRRGAVSEPHVYKGNAAGGAGGCSAQCPREQQVAGVDSGNSGVEAGVSTLCDGGGPREGGQGHEQGREQPRALQQMESSAHCKSVLRGQEGAAPGESTGMLQVGGGVGGVKGDVQAKLELEGCDGGEAEQEDEGEGEEEEEEELKMLADGTHLCLCAAELKFKHPITGQDLHFEMPEPEYFELARRAAAQK